MRWINILAIALATAFVMGAPTADVAEARMHTKHKHHGKKMPRRSLLGNLRRRMPKVRMPRLVMPRARRSHADRAKARAEMRALFARMPRQKYVAPTRMSREEKRKVRAEARARAHAELRALFARVPRPKMKPRHHVRPRRMHHGMKRPHRRSLLSMFHGRKSHKRSR